MLNGVSFFLIFIISTFLCGFNFAPKGDCGINRQYNNNISLYQNNNLTFKDSYFDCLTQRFPMNYKGNCGYVGIAMLLSYYDTYLNDLIIPENFDEVSFGVETDMVERRNSPGVNKDFIFETINGSLVFGDNLSNQEFLSHIINNKNSQFICNLMNIGYELGYYKSNSDMPCLTYNFERINILNNYLTGLGFLNSRDFYIDSFLGIDSDVRNYIINKISIGQPVLASVGSYESEYGHVVIAYDYISSNNTILCHDGLSQDHTRLAIEDFGYNYFTNAMVVNFNIPHSHTNNYCVNINGDYHYYCYDSCHISTYVNSKQHNYTYSYLNNSQTHHKAFCDCGNFVLRPHAILESSFYYFNGHQFGNCIQCGATIDLGTGGGISYLNKKGIIISHNGSYKLNNGIIIINDADYNYFIEDEDLFFEINSFNE